MIEISKSLLYERNVYLLLPVSIVGIIAYIAASLIQNYLKRKSKIDFKAKASGKFISPPIPAIGTDFKWDELTPIPFRPFAGKKDHKVNMAIRNLSSEPEKWILIENTHKRTVNLRKQICFENPSHTLHAHPNERTTFAVRELYDKIINFLCDRYPQYFSIEGDQVYNSINEEYLPSSSGNIDPKQLLYYISSHIEEDLLILLKDDPTDPNEEYIMRASITGFPNGFDPVETFDKPISVIHQPVPQYRERLKTAMGRFFNRLEPIDLWYRTNWSMQIGKSLFSLDGNHGRPGQVIKQLTVDEIDFHEGAFLRVERQTFTRLPKSRANIMLVRTYTTPLDQIKKEGLGEELCRAIEGLPDDLAFYKKRKTWGNAVMSYMRL